MNIEEQNVEVEEEDQVCEIPGTQCDGLRRRCPKG